MKDRIDYCSASYSAKSASQSKKPRPRNGSIGSSISSDSRYSEVRFDDPVDVVITASIPKGKKLAGWKINGVYMSFYSSVKTFRLPEVDDSITVEAVFR